MFLLRKLHSTPTDGLPPDDACVRVARGTWHAQSGQTGAQWVVELLSGLEPDEKSQLFELLGKQKTHLVSTR